MRKRKKPSRWALATGKVYSLRLSDRESDRLSTIAESRGKTTGEYLKEQVTRLLAPF